jgi:hypothetical protein
MNIITDPEKLCMNTWYVIFIKGTRRVAGEFVISSYDKTKDEIKVLHVVNAPLKKLCPCGFFKNASNYDYCKVTDLPFPKGYPKYTKNPYYCRSLDALL